MCRKVAVATLTDQREIEVWGDGERTRFFRYIDDCIDGLSRMMDSPHYLPVNLCQDRVVTVNWLVDIVCEIAGVRLARLQFHDLRVCGPTLTIQE